MNTNRNSKGNLLLSEYAERLTSEYVKKVSALSMKEKGQYFTPPKISNFMVNQFGDISEKEYLKILDAGAGIGIFECAFCELVSSLKKPMKIHIDVYESDSEVIPFLHKTLKMCEKKMSLLGFKMTYELINEDFILKNKDIFNDKIEFDTTQEGYDFIISNPPYYKLNKESKYSKCMGSIIKGQPNIYTLFMAMCAKMLKPNGQLTVITPRSYCTGAYFKEFRRWFFKQIKPTRIHVIESRKTIFKKYNVLQEVIILTAKKSHSVPKTVIVSSSEGEPIKDTVLFRKVNSNNILIKKDNNLIIRIPITEKDELLADKIDALDSNLEKLGCKISTGPVVPFRARKHLMKTNNIKAMPLIWMQNIRDNKVIWPLNIKGKCNSIKLDYKTKKIMVAKKNYVLIKRFSTKDGKRRLNAGVFLENDTSKPYIGIENHVNYIYRINGSLRIDDAYGIAMILNSKTYNTYFQMSNGSTQVNSEEIKNLPLPEINTIRKIGKLAMKNKEEIIDENIITNELFGNSI